MGSDTKAPLPLPLAPRVQVELDNGILSRLLPGHLHLHAITIDDLAWEWAIPPNTLRMLLTGRTVIAGEDLCFFAGELGVTAEELMRGILGYLTTDERAQVAARKRAKERRKYAGWMEKRGKALGKVKAGRYTLKGKRRALGSVIMERKKV